MPPTATPSSLLIQVSDLDRSLQFYTDVCGLIVVFREADAALLAFETTGYTLLALRQVGRHGLRSGQQALGLRALCLYVESSSELDRIEGRLKALSAFQDRPPRGERFRAVRGRDPDRLPLSFAFYEPPLTDADYQSMMTQVYGIDV